MDIGMVTVATGGDGVATTIPFVSGYSTTKLVELIQSMPTR